MAEIVISTDKAKLDVAFIQGFLSQSYWAKGRTIEEVQTSIDHCLCFGIYKNGEQIGFARMLTDHSVLAYLMDVFIIEHERGNGYSKQLMEFIVNYPALQHVPNWKLLTLDAHGLYEQFGFAASKHPERLMERKVELNINNK